MVSKRLESFVPEVKRGVEVEFTTKLGRELEGIVRDVADGLVHVEVGGYHGERYQVERECVRPFELVQCEYCRSTFRVDKGGVSSDHMFQAHAM